MLHQAIVDQDERGESMSRLLPGGVADKLRREGRKVGETEKLTVTVLMSDIRGYSTIAEQTDPSLLAGQLNIHRIEMNRAVGAGGGKCPCSPRAAGGMTPAPRTARSASTTATTSSEATFWSTSRVR